MGISLSLSPSTEMTCIPTTCFLEAQELVLLVMDNCDIGMLVSWSHISPFFRRIIQGIIESRLKALITPYIPSHLHHQFFTVLDKMGSFIAGLTALAVLTLALIWKPRDVNILVPQGQIKCWVNMFNSAGYAVRGVGKKGLPDHERYPVRQRGIASAVVVCSVNPEVYHLRNL